MSRAFSVNTKMNKFSYLILRYILVFIRTYLKMTPVSTETSQSMISGKLSFERTPIWHISREIEIHVFCIRHLEKRGKFSFPQAGIMGLFFLLIYILNRVNRQIFSFISFFSRFRYDIYFNDRTISRFSVSHYGIICSP